MKLKLTTSAILINIFKCICVFYAVYYGVGSIVFAIYSLDHFDGKIPFNFKNWIDFDKCCTYEKGEIVNTISMFVTFPISGGILGLHITNWVWDYAITTSVVHILLSCLVMLYYPESWSWWVSLVISLVLMIVVGEGVSALKRYRNRARLVVPELEEQHSYMYR